MPYLRYSSASSDPPDHPELAQTYVYLSGVQSILGRIDDAMVSRAKVAYISHRSQSSCSGPSCKQWSRPDGAPLDVCNGCLRIFYCSMACQTADWKREGGHKAECKAVAAEGRAAAAAAAEEGGAVTRKK